MDLVETDGARTRVRLDAVPDHLPWLGADVEVIITPPCIFHW
jgi:hypothetical protein